MEGQTGYYRTMEDDFLTHSGMRVVVLTPVREVFPTPFFFLSPFFLQELYSKGVKIEEGTFRQGTRAKSAM